MFAYVCRRKTKKQRIMKHRQFKTKCKCIVKINKNIYICENIEKIKRIIYSFGTRGEKYMVDVIEIKSGEVNDTYLMKYTKEGPNIVTGKREFKGIEIESGEISIETEGREIS